MACDVLQEADLSSDVYESHGFISVIKCSNDPIFHQKKNQRQVKKSLLSHKSSHDPSDLPGVPVYTVKRNS